MLESKEVSRYPVIELGDEKAGVLIGENSGQCPAKGTSFRYERRRELRHDREEISRVRRSRGSDREGVLVHSPRFGCLTPAVE